MGRVLTSSYDFSHVLGNNVHAEEGVMLARDFLISGTDCDSRYLVLVSSLVRNWVCNGFKIEIVVTCRCLW